MSIPSLTDGHAFRISMRRPPAHAVETTHRGHRRPLWLAIISSTAVHATAILVAIWIALHAVSGSLPVRHLPAMAVTLVPFASHGQTAAQPRVRPEVKPEKVANQTIKSRSILPPTAKPKERPIEKSYQRPVPQASTSQTQHDQNLPVPALPRPLLAPMASVLVPVAPPIPVAPPRSIPVRRFHRHIQPLTSKRPAVQRFPPSSSAKIAALQNVPEILHRNSSGHGLATSTPKRSPLSADMDAKEKLLLGRLASWLNEHRKYPELARIRGWQGRVIIRLVGNGAGRLRVTVARSSGVRLLDEASVVLVRRAVSALAVGSVRFGPLLIPIDYTLQNGTAK